MIRSLDGLTPRVHETAYVSEAAYVIGDVEIGPGSSVWPGAVIRGDDGRITIGERTNVQDNAVVHADGDARIGNLVTIGHGVVCHARLVGDLCLIGNGAVVNDGVEIGECTLVAAGSTVPEGKKLPSHSLVGGSPARVRGRMRDRFLEQIRRAADLYAERAQRYRRGTGRGPEGT
ncbi:MAG: gamma carbonic anhydrase family protein [Gemmatimonadetes bacterium]|nr:gamma carbonic anhydrase family protein [Gemmatimonadota bacterium]